MHSEGQRLREKFLELLEDGNYLTDEEKQHQMLAACGKLWNCTDVMPSDVREELDDTFEYYFHTYRRNTVFTYAQASRRLRAILKNPESYRNRWSLA